MNKAIIAILGALLVGRGGDRPAPSPRPTQDTKVYYFGLLSSYTKPIDEKEIESFYDLTSVVRPVLPDILRLLRSRDAPGGTFNHNVRLKLVPPDGKPIMLGYGGNVVGLGEPHSLSVETCRKLKHLIFSAFPEE